MFEIEFKHCAVNLLNARKCVKKHELFRPQIKFTARLILL